VCWLVAGPPVAVLEPVVAVGDIDGWWLAVLAV